MNGLINWQLEGRTAWVSAGARGIGRAIVLELVRSGATVVFGDLDKVGIGEVVRAGNQLRAGSTLGVECDFADPGVWGLLERATPGEAPPVSILVNNVGVNLGRAIEGATLEQYDLAQATNQRAAWLGVRTAVPHMKRFGRGSVVFVSSAMLLINSAHSSIYAACKGGMLGMARAFSVELAPHQIRVNTVFPGYVMVDPPGNYREKVPPELWSEFAARFNPHWEAPFAQLQPLPRGGRPEDVAALTGFLASDASRFITGAEIPVDGGVSRVGFKPAGTLQAASPWTPEMSEWITSHRKS